MSQNLESLRGVLEDSVLDSWVTGGRRIEEKFQQIQKANRQTEKRAFLFVCAMVLAVFLLMFVMYHVSLAAIERSASCDDLSFVEAEREFGDIIGWCITDINRIYSVWVGKEVRPRTSVVFTVYREYIVFPQDLARRMEYFAWRYSRLTEQRAIMSREDRAVEKALFARELIMFLRTDLVPAYFGATGREQFSASGINWDRVVNGHAEIFDAKLKRFFGRRPQVSLPQV